MTLRLRHRVRRDTAGPGSSARRGNAEVQAGVRAAGGEGRLQTRALGLAGTGAGPAPCPGVIDPAQRPGGEGLHTPPLLASWREDEMAELGPGSRRGVGFLSLPTLATPLPPPLRHLPGRRTFARLLPAGVALPDHASRVPRSGVSSLPLRTSQSPGFPGPRKASRSRGTLGTGPAALGPATLARSAGAPGLLTPGLNVIAQ